jgi:hypothetical protein
MVCLLGHVHLVLGVTLASTELKRCVKRVITPLKSLVSVLNALLEWSRQQDLVSALALQDTTYQSPDQQEVRHANLAQLEITVVEEL